MQILVATLRGAVYQQQRAAAYAALLPSLESSNCMRAAQDVSFFHQFREKLSLGDFMTGFWVQVTNRAFFFDYDVIHRWHRPFEVYDVI